WLFTRRRASAKRAEILRQRGIEVIETGIDEAGRLSLGEILATLVSRGITRLLVEGGAQLAASLLRQRLVDRLIWFQAPRLIGGDGRAAVAELGVEALAEALRLERERARMLAGDACSAYIVRAE
ncbi:MAG: RibD family protein, partial [Geminicoccaceae bacterium]